MTEISEALYELINYILNPLFEMLFDNFAIDLSSYTISPGFGEITWFTIDLESLLIIVTSGFVWFSIVWGIWKMIYFIYNIMRGGFTL